MREDPVPPVDAKIENSPPRSPGKQKPGRQRVERPTIEIEGQRAIVVEALLHFDGEAEPRIVSWR